MRVLVVATNETRAELAHEVRSGRHHRVDYFELAQLYGGMYYDYNQLTPNWLIQCLERKGRMDVRLAAMVAAMAKTHEYDVVISLSERVGIPLALLLHQRVHHMVIFHHGMSRHKLRFIKMLGLHRRWHAMTAISRAEADGMAGYLGLDSIVPLHTPVDVDFYRPIEASTGHEGFIQSLGLSYRDYPTLIRAMRRLPDIPCQLRVGSSWVDGRGGHEQEALPENISLQPFVHPSELRRCYQDSRFIIVPIRATTQWSAGCTSVQAAQAMGKPVIATRMPGLSEYLIDGETGLLVEPGDDQAMAEAIEMLWKDPQRVVQMGRKAREWMREQHGLDRWLDKVSHIIEQLRTPSAVFSFIGPLIGSLLQSL